jgi:hypothetical protein
MVRGRRGHERTPLFSYARAWLRAWHDWFGAVWACSDGIGHSGRGRLRGLGRVAAREGVTQLSPTKQLRCNLLEQVPDGLR